MNSDYSSPEKRLISATCESLSYFINRLFPALQPVTKNILLLETFFHGQAKQFFNNSRLQLASFGPRACVRRLKSTDLTN